ncbi:MAG: hypothetical protein EA389_14940 [Ilumatobacter sp.]|nr:MAG: hypothetical protein EA389_14940 [Ilumatobacter sp.]
MEPLPRGTYGRSVALPAKARDALTDADVNFSTVNFETGLDDPAAIGDGDPSCDGTAAAPTAPPGKVCVYLRIAQNVTDLAGFANTELEDQGFEVRWRGVAETSGNAFVLVTWAYTAP